jgi:hypothetical protein
MQSSTFPMQHFDLSLSGPRQCTAAAKCNTFAEAVFLKKSAAPEPWRADNKFTLRGRYMKKIFALAALLLPLAVAGCSHRTTVVYAAPPPPPPAFSPAAQQGYHDGVDAARRDINHGYAPDVNRHPRFRNPPVPPPVMEEYRHGFRAGYEQSFRQGPPPPQGPGYY